MTTATKTRGPSPRRTRSSKNRSATASPLTAGEVVLQALCAETRALRKAERKVRDGDPKGITQIRVAIRQLRSTLRGFSRILDRQVTRPVRSELAWLGRQLGEENDTQSTLKELTTARRPAAGIDRGPGDRRQPDRAGPACRP